MDAAKNPFSPGAGISPPTLAGREDILCRVQSCLKGAQSEFAGQAFLLEGVRGIGKTVLLNEIARRAENCGYIVTQIELCRGQGLQDALLPAVKKVLRSLCIQPPAVTEGFDLFKAFDGIGKAIKSSHLVWVLLVDEIQFLTAREANLLSEAIRLVQEKRLPVVFVAAGLSVPEGNLANLSQPDRIAVDLLSSDAVAHAVSEPLRQNNVRITDDALKTFVQASHGYPFFVQTLAFHAWNLAGNDSITDNDIKSAFGQAMKSLWAGFFKVRTGALTPDELKYLKSMASLGPGQHAIAAVDAAFGTSDTHAAKLRTRLLEKGLIHRPAIDRVDFSVPFFAEFVSQNLDF